MSDFAEGAYLALLAILAVPVVQQAAWSLRRRLEFRREARRMNGLQAWGCGHVHALCLKQAPITDWITLKPPTCLLGANHEGQHKANLDRGGTVLWGGE